MARTWRSRSSEIFADQDPAGSLRLRRALAAHLREWRGVDADPANILITSGSSGALQLVLDVLADPGDTVAVEDPGYPALHRLLSRRALDVALIPVDAQGACVSSLPHTGRAPRLAFVTPSHQFPLGGAMSIARRQRLLDWATTVGAVVIEDDYDSEFRYSGRPFPALAALPSRAPVVYIGTTSKVFSPSLRLGYLVAPEILADRLREGIARYEQRASIVPQHPLADFIETGEFARHLRRMRRIYSERRQILVGALRQRAARLRWTVDEAAAGLQLVARFQSDRVDDLTLEQQCAERGVGARALSGFYRGKPSTAGFLIGFAAFDAFELAAGFEELTQVLEAV